MTDEEKKKKKEAIWWSGLPNTSAWAQKHRDVSLSMKLKWLPLLKPHLKHSLRLQVCCEVLTIYEKFSISCVKLTVFLRPIIALTSVNSLSVVCVDCHSCIFMTGALLSANEKPAVKMAAWCCRDVVVRCDDGRTTPVPPGPTHSHTTHTDTLEA